MQIIVKCSTLNSKAELYNTPLSDEPKINIHSLYTPVKKNGYSFHLRTSDERSKNNIENIFNNRSENISDECSIKGVENKSGLDEIMQIIKFLSGF